MIGAATGLDEQLRERRRRGPRNDRAGSRPPFLVKAAMRACSAPS